MNRFNLLSSNYVMKLVKSILFPYVLQILTLCVFIFLILNGLHTGAASGIEKKVILVLRKTNLTTLLVWGIWWPGLILVTILFGRLWCTICPMELVNNVSFRISRALRLKGSKLPRWVRGGFAILLLYCLMQLLVAGFSVHRVPLYTSFVLLSLLSIAFISGLLFTEQRSFCRGFCPAALLLNLYNRFTPFSLVKNSDSVCTGCKTKDCVKSENRDRFDARSCPSYLRPFALSQNDDCVLCFQCAKVCPYGNIGFSAGGKKIEEKPLPLAYAFFILIAVGFVSHDLFAEVEGLDLLFHKVPQFFADLLHQSALFAWFEAIWFLLLLPLCILTIMRVTSYFLKGRYTLTDFLMHLTLYVLPVLMAGHGIKALIKLNNWLPYLYCALREPTGISMAKNIATGAMPAFHPLLPPAVAALILACMCVFSLFFAIRLARRKLEPALQIPVYAALGILGSFYLTVILCLVKW